MTKGIAGSGVLQWLSCSNDISVAVLPHVFPMFWISLSKETTELYSCMSTVFASPQAHWPPLTAGPSPSASYLLWHKTDTSRNIPPSQGWGALISWWLGFYVSKDCEIEAGTCLFLRPPLFSVVTSITRRDHATHALSNPASWGIVGSFKSRNWLVTTLPLCQQCKCLLPKCYLGRNLSW